jgi:hypothetical protein
LVDGGSNDFFKLGIIVVTFVRTGSFISLEGITASCLKADFNTVAISYLLCGSFSSKIISTLSETSSDLIKADEMDSLLVFADFEGGILMSRVE